MWFGSKGKKPGRETDLFWVCYFCLTLVIFLVICHKKKEKDRKKKKEWRKKGKKKRWKEKKKRRQEKKKRKNKEKKSESLFLSFLYFRFCKLKGRRRTNPEKTNPDLPLSVERSKSMIPWSQTLNLNSYLIVCNSPGRNLKIQNMSF